MLVDKQKALSVLMHKLRSTTFIKGKSKIPHNLQFVIDLAFTKIPTKSNIKYLRNGDPDINFDKFEGIFTSKGHWTFFGVGPSNFKDGERQDWLLPRRTARSVWRRSRIYLI